MKSFPTVVWDTPHLHGLDERARAELEAAGAIVRTRRGEVLFRTGEPADAIYIVTNGSFSLSATPRGSEDTREIRRCGRGDAIGEEAIVRAGTTRRALARCESDGEVARIPAALLRRVADRGTKGEVAERRERALRRRALLDALSWASFTRELPERDTDELVDCGEHIDLRRGERIYAERDPSTHVYILVEGSVQLQRERDDGKKVVLAYVAPGDLLGEDLSLAQRDASAVAVASSWLVAFPKNAFAKVARRHADAFERARRNRSDAVRTQETIAKNATQHVLLDLHRLETARSLLVIDQEACIRCGHCASSCADAHVDGIARLVRRGDKIVAHVVEERRALLVPNSCQHCRHPACMVDCPTGAIGRDARGEVTIREDLCTGCGACARACPWENVQMAPRGGGGEGDSMSPQNNGMVAVKCDMCGGAPACVSACPTEALVRIEPEKVLGELSGTQPIARTAGAPWVIGAAIASAGAVVGLAQLPRMVSGSIAATLLCALASYGVVKRWHLARLRPHAIAHVAIGLLAAAAVIAHGGAHFSASAAGLAYMAFAASAVLGGIAAATYAIVPRAIARIEQVARLPEDLAARMQSLEASLFRMLSGKGEATKLLFQRVFDPYRRAWLGPTTLVLSGRTLREERASLTARVDHILSGHDADAKDDLISTCVELRALRAQRWLEGILRAFLPVHLGFGVVAVLATVWHVYSALRYR